HLGARVRALYKRREGSSYLYVLFLAVWWFVHSNARLGSHAITRLSSFRELLISLMYSLSSPIIPVHVLSFATPFRGGSRSSAGIGLKVFLGPMMGVRFLVE